MAVLFEYLGTFCHISTSSSFSFSLSITLSLSPHAHPHTNTDPVMHNSRLCNIYAVFQSSSELSTNGAGPESSVWTQRECWRLIRWDRPKLGGQCSRRHWNHKTSIPPKYPDAPERLSLRPIKTDSRKKERERIGQCTGRSEESHAQKHNLLPLALSLAFLFFSLRCLLPLFYNSTQ